MAGAKIVVLYPRPGDADEFERAYTQEHVPMVDAEQMPGLIKFVATKFVGTVAAATLALLVYSRSEKIGLVVAGVVAAAQLCLLLFLLLA